MTVHWASIANKLHYLKVVSKSNKVGIVVGYFLLNLVKEDYIQPEDVHVIGHSMGAHVAGVSGSTFSSKTDKTIARITGKYEIFLR